MNTLTDEPLNTHICIAPCWSISWEHITRSTS